MTDLPSINLKSIMADQKRVILKHGDKPYLLSITRRGKLILTAADSETGCADNNSQGSSNT